MSAGRPATLEELVPQYMVSLWGWTILVGGVLGIIGGFWRDRITGLLIERIALLTIGGSCSVYGVVVAAVAYQTAPVTIAFCGSMSVASVWRVVHVNRELRTLTRWLRQNELH